MNTYYWNFKPDADGSVRTDVLVEQTERAPGDPLPDVLSVTFYGEEDNPLHTVRSEFLTPTTQPAG